MNIQNRFRQEVYLENTKRRFSECNVNSDLNVHIASLLAGEEEFQPESFELYSLSDIFNYLKVSHDYYLNTCIPQLEITLVQLIKKSAVNHRSTQLYFLLLNNYKNELIDHIEKEERVLFTYVQNKLDGKDVSNIDTYGINYFLISHNDNVVLEIDQLKTDMLKQNTELSNEFSFEMLFSQLEFLQRDLAIHALVEDHVFTPLLLEQM
jgi:regulator of cell morphogenesis and NO signaling